MKGSEGYEYDHKVGGQKGLLEVGTHFVLSAGVNLQPNCIGKDNVRRDVEATLKTNVCGSSIGAAVGT